jgi:hypothetical protein
MTDYSQLLALLAPPHQAAHPYMGAYAVAPGASPPMAGQAPPQTLLGTLGGVVGPAAKPYPAAAGRGWNNAYGAHAAGSLVDTGSGTSRGSWSQHPGLSSAPTSNTSPRWARMASQSPKALKAPIQGLGPFKPVA